MAAAHLISGLPCSGKTTYATALRAGGNNVLFSLDIWLITAYGPYSIAAVGQQEHVRRVLAVRELIWAASSELLRRGVDVILDDGFFLRHNRLQVVRRAHREGAQAKIHYLNTPVEVVRTRLERRNAQLPLYNFRIEPGDLQAFLVLFEPPSADEEAEVVVIDGSNEDSPLAPS